MVSTAEPPFERTVCSCTACRQCCREQPGPLVPGDVARIAAHLGMSERELADRHLCQSPGAVVQDSDTGEVMRVGTITPRRKVYSGTCVFLDPQGHCRVHPVAPFGCAFFDTHMSAEESQRRGVWYLREIAGDERYAELREMLPVTSAWRPRSY